MKLVGIVFLVWLAWTVGRGFVLSDAEQLWCLGQPHATELQSAARAMGVDGTGWFDLYNSDLVWDPAFIKVCKAAYAVDR